MRARIAAGLLTLGLAPAVALPAGAQDVLPAERAFAYSVRGLDPATVEARFAIAPGYYVYRDRLKFSVASGQVPVVLAAAPVLPPGKVKEDPFFGTVETYRGEVSVRLALAAPAPGGTLTVTAESQGCADLGICYPPQRQSLELTLPATGAGPGAPVEFAPAKKKWFN